jgi:uncharacterized protein DUF2334
MDLDGARSARLLLVPELTAGAAHDRDTADRRVRAATRVSGVGARPLRVAQQLAYKLGLLGYERSVVGALRGAREAVLGERAQGPPRFLVRVDEFPHYRAWDDPRRYGTDGFERFHEILAGAGVPYLLAVSPRVSREPLKPGGDASQSPAPRAREGQAIADPQPHPRGTLESDSSASVSSLTYDSRPLDERERALLARLAGERVAFALHGLTHRTRFASPRHHSELCGLGAGATAELLDAGLAELARAGIETKVFVPPYNRFDAAQLEQLAERFAVVCGGPESIGLLGFQGTPQWRGGTVYLPAYAPFYGHAAEVRPAVERAIDAQWGLWVPVVLHWGWEADAGWSELERLAEALAPCAEPWGDFLAAVERSKTCQSVQPHETSPPAPQPQASPSAPQPQGSPSTAEGSSSTRERERGR